MMRSIDMIDALKFAIELEEKGQQFYRDCESAVKDQSVKELLIFLANQEQKHKSHFAEMLNLVKERSVSLSQDQVSALMDAYAGSFFKGEESTTGKLAGKIGQNDVINYGIRIEKDSIAYYQKLKASLPEDCESDMNWIINTEKEHLAKLQDFKQKLSD